MQARLGKQIKEHLDKIDIFKSTAKPISSTITDDLQELIGGKVRPERIKEGEQEDLDQCA